MKEERYSIIFSSKTGNTTELANAIRDALPQENCDYFGTSEIEEPVSYTHLTLPTNSRV